MSKKFYGGSNGGNRDTVPIKSLPPPRHEVGNILVEVDNEDYQKGVLQCQFDVIGRIIL